MNTDEYRAPCEIEMKLSTSKFRSRRKSSRYLCFITFPPDNAIERPHDVMYTNALYTALVTMVTCIGYYGGIF